MIYSGTWGSREEVESEFRITLGSEIQLIFAHYSGYDTADAGDYEMWAHVLFRNAIDGKIYEVHGSHCSCYGLEDQWEPSEVNIHDVVRELTNPNNQDWGARATARNRLKTALLEMATS